MPCTLPQYSSQPETYNSVPRFAYFQPVLGVYRMQLAVTRFSLLSRQSLVYIA